MAQLVKHYFKTLSGDWATNTTKGLVMPRIEGLDVKYSVTDSNGIRYMLSHVPENIEKRIQVTYQEYGQYATDEEDNELPLEDQLQLWLNANNIVGIETTRVDYSEDIMEPDGVPSGETRERVLFDVKYNEPYVLTESVGLTTLSQTQWDSEISSYDTRQQNKRYDAIRVTRNKMLTHTDWKVVQELETGGSVSTDFSNWRQALRDLPNSVGFPTCYPDLPTAFENDSTLVSLTGSFDSNVRPIVMINDPLPEQDNDLPG